jgi:hypothetical protein
MTIGGGLRMTILKIMIPGMVLVLGAVSGAHAQQGCSCRLPASSGHAPVGRFDSASGQVLASASGGLQQVSAGTGLYTGTQIILGPQAAASISFGSGCSLVLGPNSETTITGDDTGICVRTAQSGQPATRQTIASDAGGASPHGFGLYPFAMFGAAFSARTVFGGGDDAASN